MEFKNIRSGDFFESKEDFTLSTEINVFKESIVEIINVIDNENIMIAVEIDVGNKTYKTSTAWVTYEELNKKFRFTSQKDDAYLLKKYASPDDIGYFYEVANFFKYNDFSATYRDILEITKKVILKEGVMVEVRYNYTFTQLLPASLLYTNAKCVDKPECDIKGKKYKLLKLQIGNFITNACNVSLNLNNIYEVIDRGAGSNSDKVLIRTSSGSIVYVDALKFLADSEEVIDDNTVLIPSRNICLYSPFFAHAQAYKMRDLTKADRVKIIDKSDSLWVKVEVNKSISGRILVTDLKYLTNKESSNKESSNKVLDKDSYLDENTLYAVVGYGMSLKKSLKDEYLSVFLQKGEIVCFWWANDEIKDTLRVFTPSTVSDIKHGVEKGYTNAETFIKNTTKEPLVFRSIVNIEKLSNNDLSDGMDIIELEPQEIHEYYDNDLSDGTYRVLQDFTVYKNKQSDIINANTDISISLVNDPQYRSIKCNYPKIGYKIHAGQAHINDLVGKVIRIDNSKMNLVATDIIHPYLMINGGGIQQDTSVINKGDKIVVGSRIIKSNGCSLQRLMSVCNAGMGTKKLFVFTTDLKSNAKKDITKLFGRFRVKYSLSVYSEFSRDYIGQILPGTEITVFDYASDGSYKLVYITGIKNNFITTNTNVADKVLVSIDELNNSSDKIKSSKSELFGNFKTKLFLPYYYSKESLHISVGCIVAGTEIKVFNSDDPDIKIVFIDDDAKNWQNVKMFIKKDELENSSEELNTDTKTYLGEFKIKDGEEINCYDKSGNLKPNSCKEDTFYAYCTQNRKIILLTSKTDIKTYLISKKDFIKKMSHVSGRKAIGKYRLKDDESLAIYKKIDGILTYSHAESGDWEYNVFGTDNDKVSIGDDKYIEIKDFIEKLEEIHEVGSLIGKFKVKTKVELSYLVGNGFYNVHSYSGEILHLYEGPDYYIVHIPKHDSLIQSGTKTVDLLYSMDKADITKLEEVKEQNGDYLGKYKKSWVYLPIELVSIIDESIICPTNEDILHVYVSENYYIISIESFKEQLFAMEKDDFFKLEEVKDERIETEVP